jgi:hypothetical protein
VDVRIRRPGEGTQELTGKQAQKWDADANEEIDDDGPTLLAFRNRRRLHSGDLVQPAVDAERSGRERGVQENEDS